MQLKSDRVIDQYQALLEIADLIVHHQTLPELFHKLAMKLRTAVDFEFINFSLHDPELNVMRLRILECGSSTKPEIPLDLPPEETGAGWVWLHQKPLLINDITNDERFPKILNVLRKVGMKAYCILPLTTSGQRLGALGFYSSRPNVYAAEDLAFLQRVANLVAVVVESSITQGALVGERELGKVALALGNDAFREIAALQEKLFQEKRCLEQENQLRAGQNRILEMIATGAPLEPTLESLVRLIESQSEGILGSIVFLDADGIHLRHGAAPSLPEAYTKLIDGASIGPKNGSCGTAMYRNAPVIVTDLLLDPLWADYRDLAAPFGLRACWSTPIRSSTGKILGSFAMYYREARSPGPEEMQLIEIATHIAGIAIERKQAEVALTASEASSRRLLQASKDTEEQINLLQTIATEVAEAKDLSSALEVLLRRVCEKTGWVLGQAWTPRRDGTVLERNPAWFTATDNFKRFRMLCEPVTFPSGIGLPGRVWSSKQPAWIPDVTLDPNFPRATFAREAGLRAGLGIPIIAGEVVIAVLEFFLREPRSEDERLMNVITAVAAQLGLAIERKNTEATLRESEERYRTLVEHAPDAIVVVDVDTMLFADVNENAVRLFGFPRESLLKIGPAELSPENQADGRASAELVPEILQKTLAGGAPTFEWIHRNAAGQDFPCEVRLVRLPSAEHRLVRASVTDITERKRAQEALRHSEQQLLQAQKMEAVGRLAGGVAHDFNNLLNVISGFNELMLYEFPPDAPLRSHAENIRSASRRATDLVRQLMTLSRQQPMAPKNIDLNAVVRESMEMLPRLLSEEIEIEVRTCPHPALVRADPTQIHQVIINLAVNARDAMPHGGRLKIETTRLQLDEESAQQYPPCRAGKYVQLSVSDTGVGIPPDAKEHVFEPFFTTKEVGKGTGLGLSTVYGIVQQAGGGIFVSSEPGQGATFQIYLPEIEMDVESAAAGEPAGESLRGSGTILLVEDQDNLRVLFQTFLERQGYKVLAAGRPTEAIEIAAQCKEDIHLLLTDVVMPEMRGTELAGRVYALYPGIKTLFISGYAEEILQNRDLNGASFLEKPVSLQTMARKVREMLQSSEAV